MFVEFNTDWEQYKAGQLADVETTLARRLVGLGVAAHPQRAVQRTTPQPEMERYTPVETATDEEKPAPKKKPLRRYKRREKAVEIDD